MADDVDVRPIIRKKVVVKADGHHGGAWKVAYADFVTAMMAFFLLLWLLGSTSKDTRDALADYFSPAIPIIDTSGGGQDVFAGDSVFAAAERARDGTGGVDLSEDAGSSDPSSPDQSAPDEGANTVRVIDFLSPTQAGALEKLQEEQAALAAEREALEEAREALEAARAALEARSDAPIDDPAEAAEAIASLEQEVASAAERAARAEAAAAEAHARAAAAEAAAAEAEAALNLAESAAGLAELERLNAEAAARQLAAATGAMAAERRAEEATFSQIEAAFDSLRSLAGDNVVLEHLTLRRTADGLTIEIAETDGDSLFDSGSAEPSERLRQLADFVAPVILSVDNQLAVIGHTDAAPFAPGSAYTNWELSADRANAARRLFKDLGVPQERFARVAGAADRDPLIVDDPLAPQNRRIGVTLLTAEAARRARGEAPIPAAPETAPTE